VSVLLLWPLLVEPLVGALLHAVGVEHPFKWLPYNAGIGIANPEADPDTAEHLARLAGGLYFFGVAAAIALLGAVLTDRRDA